MKPRTIERTPRPRRLLRTAGMTCLLVFLAGSAQGQVQPDPRIKDHIDKVDYFTIGTDPRAAAMNGNVEKYHMGSDTFWQDYNKKDYGRALGSLRFVLGYVPNHPRALHMMVDCCKRMGDPYYPIRYFERAVKLYPHRAYTRAQYGSYFIGIGEIARGIEELRQAVKVDSTLWVARAWLQEAEERASPTPPDAP